MSHEFRFNQAGLQAERFDIFKGYCEPGLKKAGFCMGMNL
jgi:hypothetical protein